MSSDRIGDEQELRRNTTVQVSVTETVSDQRAAITASITINRISQIRYPSAPAWSPDRKSIAFLWDAWGSRICSSSRRREAEGVTDFPADPTSALPTLVVHVVSSNEILLSMNESLWTVSPASAEPARIYGRAR
jgi:hypothetical protein